MHRPHFSFVNSTKTTLQQITLTMMLMKSVEGMASVKASSPYPLIGKSEVTSATSRQVSRSCVISFSGYH